MEEAYSKRAQFQSWHPPLPRDRCLRLSVTVYTSRARLNPPTCDWKTGSFTRFSVMTLSMYADRWLRISTGRFPSGFLDRLIVFRGLDIAIGKLRYCPMAFSFPGSFVFMTVSSWAALAKVSRWPTRFARSSYAQSGSNRSLCLREIANARMRLIPVLHRSGQTRHQLDSREVTNSLARRSSFPSSPSRSSLWIQMIRARMREYCKRRAQYFRPSAYLRPISTNPGHVEQDGMVPFICGGAAKRK